jgi:glycerol-3-phosphate dehydrogenase (NAD(P)+)
MTRIAILGAGAWGSALAIALADGANVCLWTRSPEHAERMRIDRSNARYLPGFSLPTSLQITAHLDDAVAAADILIAAVPTSGFRGLLTKLRERSAIGPLIWLCKGFEAGSGKLPHQVLADVWPQPERAGVLSGPSFAHEVARNLPTAMTLATPDADFARQMARQLSRPRVRIYASSDVVGVEVGGAVKNVMAIAAGISDGLGFGLNARAALVTRGLAEITRLGLALGGQRETFMGLSGIGDLMLTCTGDLSRNRQVGLQMAKGDSLEHVLRGLGHVAEGVTSAGEVLAVAQAAGVEMPIAAAVQRILKQELPPTQAVAELLGRALRDEG